jgi:hypothetical protein
MEIIYRPNKLSREKLVRFIIQAVIFIAIFIYRYIKGMFDK